MKRFTKEERERIARDFAQRNGGRFEPAAFVAEVQKTGKSHPAYEWFEWDVQKAAQNWWIDQAREFVSDLRIVFSVQDVTPGKYKVQSEYPMFISPLANRRDGGGYNEVDPDSRDDLVEIARQASRDLTSWLGRYRSALERLGHSTRLIDQALTKINSHLK